MGGLDFPRAAQAIRITRRVRNQKTKKWRTVTIYTITSLTARQAGPAELAGHMRGHWRIEALHHIRDVTYAIGSALWGMQGTDDDEDDGTAGMPARIR